MAEKNFMILCDTNVIIEILKGNEKTLTLIERKSRVPQIQGVQG
jgi:predicted nucleic acid-binding protein